MRPNIDRHVMYGALLLTLVFGAFLLVMSGEFQNLFSGGGRAVRVILPNAQQLRATGFMHGGSEVRIDGVNVGDVDGISLDPGGRTATATLNLDASAGPLYADASAALRWQSLLGANFYVAIDRGSPSAGPLSSGVIQAVRTSDQIELEDVTSVLQGGAKRGLLALPKPLTTGLGDPQALSSGLSTLARVSPSLATGLSALHGEQPADLQMLINSTGSVLDALNAPTEQLRQVIAGAAATLGATANQQSNLQRTISQAPGALQSTDVTLQQLDGTLSKLNPLIAKLQQPAPEVAPTFAALHPTVNEANALLNNAVPLLHALRPTAGSLEGTSRLGLPLLNQLTPILDKIGGYILPYLNQVDPQTQHTTAEMIGPGLAAYANAAGGVDTQGRMIHFDLSFGNSPLLLPCQEYFTNPTAPQLLACQSLSDMLKTVLTYNPLAPSQGTTTGPGGARR
jgi:phospholipid/cholesterol/gamma-HCH transport system substrate-binding protein